MLAHRMVVAGLALALVASPARAQNIVCDGIPPALRAYGAIADTIITKLGPSQDPDEPWGNTIYRRACTRSARLAATVLDPLLVATTASGVAVRFTEGRLEENHCWNYVQDGELVTGGGTITGLDLDECVDGTVDTSGTNPEVPACTQALVDAVTVSDAFASEPAARDLGNVTVPVFTTYTLMLAANEVIHIGKLDLKGGYDPDFKNLCLDHTTIRVRGGPGVVNIDRLEVGPCVDFVHDRSVAVIFNVPGPGAPIKVGRGANVRTPILAPRRNISVRGTLDDDITFMGTTWARRIKMYGLSTIEQPFPNCP